MPWNPDSGDPLSAAPVHIAGVEASSMAAWSEFLKGWFDGGTHVLAGAQLKCPETEAIVFQDQALPSNKDGLYLTVAVTRPPKVNRRLWADNKWMMTERAQIDFFFRAQVKAVRPDGHTSRSLVRWGSDVLFAVLSNIAAVTPLSYCGIGGIRCQPGALIVDGQTPMRHLPVTATYTYPSEDLTTQAIADAVPSWVRGPIGYDEHGRPYEIKIAVVDGQPTIAQPEPAD